MSLSIKVAFFTNALLVLAGAGTTLSYF